MTAESFNELALSPAQLKNLQSLGYLQMTPVQAQTLPPALAGRDLIAQAKTGSGKTAAFALPLLDQLNPRDFGAQALVLCPTRELATQVATEIRRLARHQQNIKVVILCGGQPIGPQIGSLDHGAHIVVGTPGRITDHLRKQTLSLQRANCVVLDEADRMLDMGFIKDIRSILAQTPSNRQTLLFSATYPDDMLALSQEFQTAPLRISLESVHDEQKINQHFYLCGRKDKLNALQRLLSHYRPLASIIFCNTKDSTREVCSYLKESGIPAMGLHGDLEQRDRDQILVQFRQQSCRVLVATDVAARGLDIDDLPAVINYDLPRETANYVHRIGRTGRAGKKGLALCLFADSERYKLDRIGKLLERQLDIMEIDSLPATDKALPPPSCVSIRIAAGRKEKIRPGDILGALTGDAGIAGKAVGKIDVMEYATFVAIARPQARRALARLQNGTIKGRKFKARSL